MILKKASRWEKLLLVTGFRKKYKVEGHSMSPIISHGEKILIKKVKQFSVSDIVVSKHPVHSEMVIVKKVEAIDEKGRLKLAGVNRLESSHRFGLIHPSKIIGKVTSKLD